MKDSHYDILDDLLTGEERSIMNARRAEVRAALQAAELLHSVMMEEGLNQKALAERLEVTPGFVSRILAGDENPSVRKLAAMFHRLGREYVQSVRMESEGRPFYAESGEMPTGNVGAEFAETPNLSGWGASLKKSPVIINIRDYKNKRSA